MRYDSITGKGVVNTIVLNPANGLYEEYVLDKDIDQGASVLPGAVVCVVPVTAYYKVPELVKDGSSPKAFTDADGNTYYKGKKDPNTGLPILENSSHTYQATQADGISTAIVSYPDPDATTGWENGFNVDTFEPYIVIENALLGKTINHLAFPGEVTPVYRPVAGDRFLLRAVPGNYKEGDPLYFTKTGHGIYVTNDAAYNEGVGTTDTTITGSVIKAYAAESFVITDSTNYDAIDNSTMERPSTKRPWKDVQNGVMNLLRVRFA